MSKVRESPERLPLEPAFIRARAAPRPGDWWNPRLDPAVIRELLSRRDLPGILHILAWFGAVAASTGALAAVWGQWIALPVFLGHSALLSFTYAASHETAHGTAFETKALNEFVFYLTSFVFGEEPMYRRYSHGRHHAYTWYSGLDSQMPYRNPVTLSRYFRESLGIFSIGSNLLTMTRHARGHLHSDEQAFVPAARVSQMVWGARLFLFGYVSIITIGILLETGFLIVAFFGSRVAGQWVVQLFINSQHMCMREDVSDHRYCTRSMTCGRLTRVLYWNMNHHVEHHLYPGVPFHALPRLSRVVAPQLPEPSRGVFAANREILRAIRAQESDPSIVCQPSMPPTTPR